jgi:hypothetical protein
MKCPATSAIGHLAPILVATMFMLYCSSHQFAKILALSLCLLSHVAFAQLTPPKLLAPVNGSEITDVATFFRWAPQEGANEFEVQIAREGEFKEIFRSRRTLNKGFHKNLWFPRNVLPAGEYFWRVRAVKANESGPWSEVFRVKVNENHAVAPDVVRPIGPRTPLFLMRSRAWDPLKNSQNAKAIIPPGLERVIVIDDIALASEKVIERARKYQEIGLDFVIWNNRCQVPLSTIEYLFQNFSHCIGTAEGEHFDGITWEKGPEGNLSESDFVHRAWTLCAKYGRFYFFADGDAGSYRWPNFMARDREYFQKYKRNIVPMFKTTKGDVALHSYGAVQGLMASGYAENCGVWVDEWIWPTSGFGKLGETIPEEKIWQTRRTLGTRQCPWTYDIQMWLMGIAGGSTVFHLESAHQWGAQGQANSNYTRFFLPFVKAVIERQLLPSREAFLKNIKLAVTSDLSLATGRHQKQYSGGFAYLKELYALKDKGDRELLPNNSRYGIICLLPSDINALPQSKAVPQKELLDVKNAAALFDAAYPPRFAGDAFAWECDGTIIVTNSNENQDVAQRFSMPLNGFVRELRGAVGVHQFLIGKQTKNSFWFQTNGEYPEREMEIALVCAAKPSWTITPESAEREARWNEATQTLHLKLSHAPGAVEVELK